MFTATLFTTAKTWKHPRWSLTDERIKTRYTQNNRLLLSREKERKNAICKPWMDLDIIIRSEDLEVIIRSEGRQKEKDKHFRVESTMWHEWTYPQNRNRCTDREQSGGCQGGGRAGEGRTGTLRLAGANQHTWSGGTPRWYCAAENYSQYPAVNHSGKEEKHLFLKPRFLMYKIGVAIPNLKLLKRLSTWKQSHHL